MVNYWFWNVMNHTVYHNYLTSASKTSSQSSSSMSTVSCSLPIIPSMAFNQYVDEAGNLHIKHDGQRDGRIHYTIPLVVFHVNACRRLGCFKAETGLNHIYLSKDASGSKLICEHLPRSKVFYRNTNSIKKHVMVDLAKQTKRHHHHA